MPTILTVTLLNNPKGTTLIMRTHRSTARRQVGGETMINRSNLLYRDKSSETNSFACRAADFIVYIQVIIIFDLKQKEVYRKD